MQAERLRYRFFLPKQRIIVGTAGIPKAYPRGIVLLLQQLIAPQRRITGGGTLTKQGKPKREKVTAERNILLPAAVRLRIGALQRNHCIIKLPARKSSFRLHQAVSPYAVIICNFTVVRHTAFHVCQFGIQRTGLAVVHHQHRGRIKCPAVRFLDTDSRARHFFAGAAVQYAHGRYIIIKKEACDQVALP